MQRHKLEIIIEMESPLWASLLKEDIKAMLEVQNFRVNTRGDSEKALKVICGKVEYVANKKK